MLINFRSIVVTFTLLSGCSGPDRYADPSEVTIEAGVRSLFCGVATAQNEAARLTVQTGTIIDQMEVNLALKASSSETEGLVIDTSPAPRGLFSRLGINASQNQTSLGERSNQVKIVFKNIYTAGLNDPGKSVVQSQGPDLDLGPSVLYPVQDPCNPPKISEAVLEQSVGLND